MATLGPVGPIFPDGAVDLLVGDNGKDTLAGDAGNYLLIGSPVMFLAGRVASEFDVASIRLIAYA